MAVLIIDDNSVSQFIDDNSVQCFVDDLGNFTFCPNLAPNRRYKYTVLNVCIALIASAVVMAMPW